VGLATAVNADGTRPVDGAGDRMWTQVHSLWKNLGTTVYDAVGDTPGRRKSAALTRHDVDHRVWTRRSSATMAVDDTVRTRLPR
jgi:hypothetical protein